MQTNAIAKREKRNFDRIKRRENFLRKWTLFKARLYGLKLRSDDTRTIQAHEDLGGMKRDYYIESPYLKTDSSFYFVNPLVEDYENDKFVYKGMVKGADDAIGVLESNIPIDEIVSNPNGNLKLQEILARKNSSRLRNSYYESIDEDLAPLENHSSYFRKPDFPLGTLIQTENGKFKYIKSISKETEKLMKQDRKQENESNEKTIQINSGDGIPVLNQDCWMEQTNGIDYVGIGENSTFYKYSPEMSKETDDGLFVYLGKLRIGETKKTVDSEGKKRSTAKSYEYENIVFWTEGKNLIQFFLEEKNNGLNIELGKMFTSKNVENRNNETGTIFIGGLRKDEKGECKKTDEIPDAVKKVTEELFENSKEESIIDLDD